MSRKTVRWAIAVVALGGLAVLGRMVWASVPKGTRTVPHAAAEIRPGENLLWCATSQIAWDRAAALFGGRALRVVGASDPEGVAEMNRDPFPLSDLDPSSYVALAGSEGVEKRFAEELERTFGSVPAGVSVDSVEPRKWAALAYLRKEMRFEPGLPIDDEGLRFRPGPLPVIGCRRVAAIGGGWEYEQLDLARLHWQDDDESPNQFVVELRPATQDRILLARVDPADTLRETWDAVAARVSTKGHRMRGFDRFSIPKIDIGQLHCSFPELLGRIDGSFPGATLEEFHGWDRFRLDETGALLESTTRIKGGTMTMGPPPKLPEYVFDRPFLLALIERGATRPYFLLWVGNADLLVEWAEP